MYLLLSNIESCLSCFQFQRPENGVMQALENLTESQVSGKSIRFFNTLIRLQL